MRVAVSICAYNETTLLKAALRQFPDWIEKIVVLVSQSPWRGTASPDSYKTIATLRERKDTRLQWMAGDWKNEEDQRNYGLGMLHEYDWVLTLDADEYFTKAGWQEIRENMEDWGSCNVLVANMRTYWKTSDYRWEPGDTHKPTVAVRPLKTSFHDKREVTAILNRQVRPDLHHFSWVRTDDEVFQKVQNYMHATDFDGMAWYGNIWKAWSEDKAEQMNNLRPYGDAKTRAVFDPAPQEIKDLFS
jgi:glycosyltransferase involved in cell wall biosynthesis